MMSLTRLKVEDLPALQLERLPPELGEPAFDVVDGARTVGYPPQQHSGGQEHHIGNGTEQQGDFERAPRVDVAQHPRDASNTRSPSRGT